MGHFAPFFLIYFFRVDISCMEKISFLDSLRPELEIELPDAKIFLKWKSLTNKELQKISEEVNEIKIRHDKGKIDANELFVESNKKIIDCENWDAFLSLPQHILASISQKVNEITMDFNSGRFKKKTE